MSSVAILVPLERPHNLGRLVASVASTTPDPWRVVTIVRPDDDDAIAAADRYGCDLIRAGGTYAERINLAARICRDELLFLGADDLRFRHGWLERALAKMRGPVEVVGTNDLGNPRVVAGEHATHFLVRRAFVDRGLADGVAGPLNPAYRHCFVDDELRCTATALGVYAHAADSVVEHLHPDWGKADDDEVYAVGREAFRRDRRLFLHRARMFGWAS